MPIFHRNIFHRPASKLLSDVTLRLVNLFLIGLKFFSSQISWETRWKHPIGVIPPGKNVHRYGKNCDPHLKIINEVVNSSELLEGLRGIRGSFWELVLGGFATGICDLSV